MTIRIYPRCVPGELLCVFGDKKLNHGETGTLSYTGTISVFRCERRVVACPDEGRVVQKTN